ncbi:MAG TPA: choice-of-anchor U domain-containing protein, partial [Ramlibacter sp.]|nr:choice-of-anchor U domain-containing protein [Ramlibacter sp.]
QSISQEAAPEDKPAQLDMPLGLIDFTAMLAPGRLVETFSLFVSKNVNVNGYWKKDANGIWVNLASAPYGGSITDVGTKLRLDFQIEDNSQFDADPTVGVIRDPGAMGALPLSIVGYSPDLVLNPGSHFFF